MHYNLKLDEQVQAGLHGNFKKGRQLIEELEDDPRAQFNKGWYLLREGKLLEGHKLLDVGRYLNCFGNKHIGSIKPIWNGQRNSTVLLNLEGGLGDQIHQVRWAENLTKLNNKVIVACSPELATLFSDIKYISAIVQHEASLGVYHDYWLPAMSAVVPLKLQYKDLIGKSYISKTEICRENIGIKWTGNPQFEHEQFRVFPANLLFDAVQGHRCISLQKEQNENCPAWVRKPCLDTWEDTRRAISTCKLVISSCTSVAHLSAAMGIPTWIIVPILSYYLWALPGEKTAYYDSVTLFRQEKFGEWGKPFKEIKERLQYV